MPEVSERRDSGVGGFGPKRRYSRRRRRMVRSRIVSSAVDSRGSSIVPRGVGVGVGQAVRS